MDEIKKDIRIFSLENAVEHNGRARTGPVLGKIMAMRPELRKEVKTISSLVLGLVEEINEMDAVTQIDELKGLEPEYFRKDIKRKERKAELPSLQGIENGVVMRFAPGPSGPLHIGHTRAVILNDEYVKLYGGKLIIRLEDTNPEKIDPEAYESILEDLDWLGIEYHDVTIQSDRFTIYMEWAARLLEMGKAYICTCDVEKWRELKNENEACPHRELPPGEQLAEWKKMTDGTYRQNEASMVVKTDLAHKNPAVRDFVGMRINETPHPRTLDKYRIYPLYNFSVAVDDHLMDCTHVLRGKDHLNNTLRQEYIYRYFGWKTPRFYHYGWVSIKDTILKTSTIREGIGRGTYHGWDDVRLGTLKTMRKRGIQPEAIREYWRWVGIKQVDVLFSWENLFAYNKDLIDPVAKRYFFVGEPAAIHIEGVDELRGRAPLQPDNEEMGYRETELHRMNGEPISVYIDRSDAEDIRELLISDPEDAARVRLKDLCNLEIVSFDGDIFQARYAGKDLEFIKQGARIIQWVPIEEGKNLDCRVHKPDGTTDHGKVEEHVKRSHGEVVQFERYGFVRLDVVNEGVHAYFTHK